MPLLSTSANRGKTDKNKGSASKRGLYRPLFILSVIPMRSFQVVILISQKYRVPEPIYERSNNAHYVINESAEN